MALAKLPADRWAKASEFSAALALVGAGSAFWFTTREAPVPAAVRFEVVLPDSVKLYNVSGRRLALSRDGTQFVVVGTKGDSTRLYLRQMDETEFRVIPGSERVGPERRGSVAPP